jgi:hypothetical protein
VFRQNRVRLHYLKIHVIFGDYQYCREYVNWRNTARKIPWLPRLGAVDATSKAVDELLHKRSVCSCWFGVVTVALRHIRLVTYCGRTGAVRQ